MRYTFPLPNVDRLGWMAKWPGSAKERMNRAVQEKRWAERKTIGMKCSFFSSRWFGRRVRASRIRASGWLCRGVHNRKLDACRIRSGISCTNTQTPCTRVSRLRSSDTNFRESGEKIRHKLITIRPGRQLSAQMRTSKITVWQNLINISNVHPAVVLIDYGKQSTATEAQRSFRLSICTYISFNLLYSVMHVWMKMQSKQKPSSSSSSSIKSLRRRGKDEQRQIGRERDRGREMYAWHVYFLYFIK